MSDGIGAVAERRGRVAVIVLALAPPILLVALIARYAVNVPVGDEWVVVPLVEKWRNHQLSFADLYQQHNEHRILISKLIFLGFAEWTNWNLRAEMFFSVALCALTSVGLLVLLRRTLAGAHAAVLPLWAVANLLLFSPVQAQNWLWGFQLQMFVPNLCLVGTLVVLGCNWSAWAKLAASLLLVTTATFSFANALLLWPIVALVLLMRRERKLSIALWLLVFVSVAAVYLVGYYRVPAPQPVRGHWLDYPRYFLVFVGGAIGRREHGAMLAAAVGLAIFVACVARLVRSRGDAMRFAAPWLALAMFALGSAALTAYSRVNWRSKQALESRYTSVSLYFYLALIVVALLATPDSSHRGSPRVRRLTGGLIVSIVLLSIAGWFSGVNEMAMLRHERLIGLAAVEFSRVIDTTYWLRGYLRMVPGFAASPVQTIALAERLGLLRYPVRTTALLEAPPAPPREAGRVEGVTAGDTAVQIHGWAILPRLGVPAPLVAIACRAHEHWFVISLAEVGEARPDGTFDGNEYRASGWRATVGRGTLHPGCEALSAWAIDPLANSSIKLAPDYAIR